MSPENPSSDQLARQTFWFNQYIAKADSHEPTLPLRCPCCGFKTLYVRGEFDICAVCFWEDDGQDDDDADVIRGGPNGMIGLTEARRNYAQFGVCELRFADHVRRPRPEEFPV